MMHAMEGTVGRARLRLLRQRHNLIPLILVAVGLALMALLLGFSRAAQGQGAQCPPGWEPKRIDPVGDVCVDPGTGDPVLPAFAWVSEGLEPPDTVEQPEPESPGTQSYALCHSGAPRPLVRPASEVACAGVDLGEAMRAANERLDYMGNSHMAAASFTVYLVAAQVVVGDGEPQPILGRDGQPVRVHVDTIYTYGNQGVARRVLPKRQWTSISHWSVPWPVGTGDERHYVQAGRIYTFEVEVAYSCGGSQDCRTRDGDSGKRTVVRQSVVASQLQESPDLDRPWWEDLPDPVEVTTTTQPPQASHGDGPAPKTPTRNNPDCTGPDCRFDHTDQPCGPNDRNLWAWGACKGEPPGEPARSGGPTPDPVTGTRCYHGTPPAHTYFNCNDWPTPEQHPPPGG